MKYHSVSLLIFIVFALSLATHGVKGNISFSLVRADSTTFKRFIKQLRQHVTAGTNHAYNIPVLNRSVPASERFGLIDITNESNESITLAIDVEDVRIVGYLTRNNSYFFPDAPSVAVQTLFSNSANRNILNFRSGYEYLESSAGKTRLEIVLGLTALNNAVSSLFHCHDDQSLAASFLVVVQMITEAARFKFIEQRLYASVRHRIEFTPPPAFLSLEDNWFKLSSLIQGSATLQGIFRDSIQLLNSKNQSIKLDSIYYPIIYPNVALIYDRCNSTIDGNVDVPSFIRMPLPGADRLNSDSDRDSCQVLQSTKHISGRDGLCVDLERNRRFDGNPIILWTCGGQVNQKWDFEVDGTIRSFGKCMSISNGNEKSVVLYNCSLAGAEATTWKISKEGTIINPSFGLVLTAEASTLKARANTYITGQGWRVGDNIDPIVCSIIGMYDTCLEATNRNTNVWMENCFSNSREQDWALYSDQTIRVNTNRSLCLTNSMFEELNLIVIRTCDGSAKQRWIFKPDNSIFNPESGMVWDVKDADFYEMKIVLKDFHGGENQQWLPFY